MSLVASPRLLEKTGTPQLPADLSKLPSMDMGMPQSQHVWSLIGPNGAHVDVHHNPRFVTRSMLALRAGAASGVGVVQLPTMMVREEIERGVLVHVIPGWAPRRELIHAVFGSRRGLLPAVRALIDDLAERFARLEED